MKSYATKSPLLSDNDYIHGLKNLDNRVTHQFFYKECYFKRDATGEPIWIDSLQYALLREEWEAQHEAAKMEDHFYQSV